MKTEQLSFFQSVEPTCSLEEKIANLQKKIENIRSGLFKRYDESKRAIEFLEGEVEDLIKANLEKFGT